MGYKLFLTVVLLFMITGVFAQYTDNRHFKEIALISDSVVVDTLSLVPSSIKITTPDGNTVDSLLYTIDYANALLVFKQGSQRPENIAISYQTFPYLFSAPLKHKDPDLVRPDLYGRYNPFSYTIESKNDDIFKMDGLSKTGSISRGITFGNNQDLVVNSNLNLQLSGRLSNNIDILLAATDNNIPIQPDGNTQQLQEFDKVFIQLSKDETSLIAGDFQLLRPNAYFMNFHKKAQGLSFATALPVHSANTIKKNNTQSGETAGIYKTSLSAAVSRGKFSRNVLIGIEGNQGPYKLRGAENEAFIIILSGTEKVFIDGRLLDRGQENDYIIDYNTAEVTFTAKQLITKDKRIVVEFQYSDRNYTRSLLHFGNDFEKGALQLHLNVYSEQDSKNQPLQQNLSAQQRQLLSDIGDTLTLAVVPSVDSVAFSNSEVLYKKIDSTVSGQIHTLYVHSTNSDSAHYRITFSNVGQGNGDYVQINSSANGKVFQWLAPIGGVKQGSYAPVIQLITPKQKQMVTAGVDYAFSKNSKLNIEAALSNNDINTFSKINNSDNTGYGLKMNFDNAKVLRKKESGDSSSASLTLLTNMNYEYVQNNFSPIERYRSVEFERDWNRGSTAQLSDQHIIGTTIGIQQRELGTLAYKFNAFLEGSNYNANKQFLSLNMSRKGFNTVYDGSILNTSSATNSVFYRHKSNVFKEMKHITIGVKDEFENNRFSTASNDSLLVNSYQFWEWQAYIQNADTSKNRYGFIYKQRNDFAAGLINAATTLKQSAHAESYNGFFELLQNPSSQLKINTSYRILQIVDTSLTLQKPDNSLVSRIEYNFRLWKGLLSSNTYYEIGSGLEVKKEFAYIEVAPGQGVYTWNDYNENGIKELNEFEVAAFQNTATYIRVFTPTLDYIKVYTNQFSQMLLLKPAALWANKTGIKKFISRFSNQTAYRIDRKTTDSDVAKAYNPFLAETKDSLLATLNSSFRNTLFINQLSPVFGMELTYQDVRNKALLVNGFDTRQNKFGEATVRWNMSQKFWWELNYKNGQKTSNSEYFSSRDYSINYSEASPRLNYQPTTNFRTTLSFKHTDKRNKAELGAQHAVLQDYGVELKYNVLQKGSLNLKTNFIQIRYNDSQNTSLAFEMLDALQKGKNITWELGYQRNLTNNMQLSLTYSGRTAEDSKAIHTGGAQVRAYF